MVVETLNIYIYIYILAEYVRKLATLMFALVLSYEHCLLALLIE